VTAPLLFLIIQAIFYVISRQAGAYKSKYWHRFMAKTNMIYGVMALLIELSFLQMLLRSPFIIESVCISIILFQIGLGIWGLRREI